MTDCGACPHARNLPVVNENRILNIFTERTQSGTEYNKYIWFKSAQFFAQNCRAFNIITVGKHVFLQKAELPKTSKAASQQSDDNQRLASKQSDDEQNNNAGNSEYAGYKCRQPCYVNIKEA